jgi:N-acylneuraminate cytidylyltransferase
MERDYSVCNLSGVASGMMDEAAKQESTTRRKHDVLAVVMARGGSVGLPGKALRPLLGRPVLAYTLDHVRESRWITRTLVSSDDRAILAIAGREGFETIERPAELATASSATDPVLRHAVRSHGGADSEAVVMLYGNVPLRRGDMIDRCIEMLFDTGCDSVQTIAPVGKMHPYWMFDREESGRIRKHVPNDIFRRQDLPPLYSPTGAVYVMRTQVLMAAEASADPHAFLGADRRGLVVQPEESVDIDTEKDLFIAEAMLRLALPK